MAGADRLASLRPASIEDVVIAGTVYRVPAHAAFRWLETLLPDPVDLWEIVPGMLEPSATDAVIEELTQDRMTREDIIDLGWELVSIAAGRPWWEAMNLIHFADDVQYGNYVWGRLALHGVDPTRVSLAAWLDAVYGVFTRNAHTAESRQKFDTSLATPPPGVTAKRDKAATRRAMEAAMRSG